MNSKLRAVIIGGVVIGVLSALPYVRLGNVICCLWIVMGGALASYLYIKKSATPVNVGEGALIGGMAGLVGWAVETLIGPPLMVLTGYPELRWMINLLERVNPQEAEKYQRNLEYLISRSFSEQFFYSIFSLQTLLNLLITIVFALVGGLVAIPLFEKRKTDVMPPPPPPPPYYGGEGGGSGAYPPPPPPPATGEYGGGYGPGA